MLNDYSRIVEEAQRNQQQLTGSSQSQGQQILTGQPNQGNQGFGQPGQGSGGQSNSPVLIQLQRTVGQAFGTAAEALKQAQIGEDIAHRVVQQAYQTS